MFLPNFYGWFSTEHIRLAFWIAIHFLVDFRQPKIQRLIQISCAIWLRALPGQDLTCWGCGVVRSRDWKRTNHVALLSGCYCVMVDVTAVVCELATKSHDVSQTQGSNDTADGRTPAQRQSTGRRGIISVSVSVSVLVSIKSF